MATGAATDDRKARSDAFTAGALGALQSMGAGVGAGFVFGALIGGVGGRLAMFLLRLTSPDHITLFTTDDGFEIGSFTADTIFLVVFTAMVGLIGGMAYLVIRRWLPSANRALLTGLMTAVIGGALFIEPGGIDFTATEPLWLAIGLFVLLPGIYGFAVSSVAEWLLAEDSVMRRAGWWGAVPALVLALAAALLAAAVAVGGGLLATGKLGSIASVWRSNAITVVGRVLLAGFTGLAGVMLVRDVVDILG